VIFYLIKTLGYTVDQVNNLLQKESGMTGLTGFSDLRDIEAEAEKGNALCSIALAMNAYRVKKYIGSYIAVMNGLDALVFTAGIGENSDVLRGMICADMDYLGIELDESLNKIRSKEIRNIEKDGARVKIMIVPTNEELEIAQQSYKLLV